MWTPTGSMSLWPTQCYLDSGSLAAIFLLKDLPFEISNILIENCLTHFAKALSKRKF